jgi:hypothetical protein
MPARSVPAHSGNHVVIGASTLGMRPSPMAMPTSALAKLLPIDQLAAHESSPAPSAYHSATMAPSWTTTTPWVFMPSANA